jgi:nicotinamidase-related amidase
MTEALLLIDIQRDYFPGGNNELAGPEEAGVQAARLLAAWREKGLPVIHIQHIAIKPGAKTFVAGTRGAEIHPCVQPLPGETVVQKHYPNSFRETPLQGILTNLGVDRLTIAGMMTHMCVHAAARAAVDLGYSCRVAGDACATKALIWNDQLVPAPHVHAAFLAALTGSYCPVTTVDAILAGLNA